MVADKMVRTKWYGQSGMDKMVYGQNVIGQNGMDKMVRTTWYEMVSSFGIDYNSSEINTYLVTKSHKQRKRHRGNVTEETSQRKRLEVTVEAGLMKRSY